MTTVGNALYRRAHCQERVSTSARKIIPGIFGTCEASKAVGINKIIPQNSNPIQQMNQNLKQQAIIPRSLTDRKTSKSHQLTDSKFDFHPSRDDCTKRDWSIKEKLARMK
ncbi:MAG: hypothetical protein ABGX16_20005, partial [Pirellulales bacterium]